MNVSDNVESIGPLPEQENKELFELLKVINYRRHGYMVSERYDVPMIGILLGKRSSF
jgi:hypothetical protein